MYSGEGIFRMNRQCNSYNTRDQAVLWKHLAEIESCFGARAW